VSTLVLTYSVLLVQLLTMNRTTPPRRAHGAKTPRGQKTRESIIKAAREICAGQWLDQLSLAELAREAHTTRASVLFQFPEGWPEIAAQLMIGELEAWAAHFDSLEKTRRKAPDKLVEGLAYLIGRSDELGAFIPNLRAFNMVWGDAIESLVMPYEDALAGRVARLLSESVRADAESDGVRVAAESLIGYLMDLNSIPILRQADAKVRRAKVETHVDFTLRGLKAK